MHLLLSTKGRIRTIRGYRCEGRRLQGVPSYTNCLKITQMISPINWRCQIKKFLLMRMRGSILLEILDLKAMNMLSEDLQKYHWR